MNVCPECGEALELRVGLVEPKLGSFIGGLVGLAAGAGFHAFVLGWATWVRASGRFGPDVRVLIPLMIGLVACGVCLWLWMAKRRRIRKLSAPWRYALVGACWGVSLATAMLFFAVVG